MSKKILENIAAKYQNIQKEVKKIMGGRVLDYEGRNIFYEGIERGKHEANVETAKRLREAGMNDTQIHQFTNLSKVFWTSSRQYFRFSSRLPMRILSWIGGSTVQTHWWSHQMLLLVPRRRQGCRLTFRRCRGLCNQNRLCLIPTIPSDICRTRTYQHPL